MGRWFIAASNVALASVVVSAAACRDATPLFDDSEPDTDGGMVSTTAPTSGTSLATTTDPTDGTASTDGTTTMPSSSGSDSASGTDTSSSSSSTGASGGPEIEVSVADRVVESGGTVDLAGTVDVGSMGAIVTLTISNTGTEPLAISAISFAGVSASHFTIADGAGISGVDPNRSAPLSVRFTPQNGGEKIGDLTISSDDADEAEYTVSLAAGTTANRWRQLVPNEGASPTPRSRAAMASLGEGRVLVFGGQDANGDGLGETWIFDVEQQIWDAPLLNPSPSSRYGAGIADTGNGKLMLFGGFDTVGAVALGDTWEFDTTTLTWEAAVPIKTPPARFAHALVGGPGSAFLYGGGSTLTDDLGDAWIYDAAGPAWEELTLGDGPGAARSVGISADGAGRATLFGGFRTPGLVVLGGTWRYDPAAMDLAEVAAATPPSPRFEHTMAYLSGGLVIGAFGGDVDAPVGGTFAYDANNEGWTLLQPPLEPSERIGHGMVGVGENKLILFGGTQSLAATDAVNDIWEYVGPES